MVSEIARIVNDAMLMVVRVRGFFGRRRLTEADSSGEVTYKQILAKPATCEMVNALL